MFKGVVHSLLNMARIEAFRSATFSNFMNTRNIDLVVDVGANLGQFAKKVRSVGYKGPILSIEPVNRVYEALAKAKVAQPWERCRTALGNSTGTVTINIPDNHTLASINPINAEGFKLLGLGSTVSQTEIVPLTTLDLLLEEDPATSIFLKVDTQGYEREVLDGASSVLKRTIGVLLELPIEHIYENVWSMNEALTYMDRIGFIPAQFRVVNTMATDTASGIEVDCIFRRKA